MKTNQPVSAAAVEPVAEGRLRKAGVFKGAHGLRGLAESNSFWDELPYTTRLYYGGNADEYLHRGVLREAIRLLDAAPSATPEAVRPDDDALEWLDAMIGNLVSCMEHLSKAGRPGLAAYFQPFVDNGRGFLHARQAVGYYCENCSGSGQISDSHSCFECKGTGVAVLSKCCHGHIGCTEHGAHDRLHEAASTAASAGEAEFERAWLKVTDCHVVSRIAAREIWDAARARPAAPVLTGEDGAEHAALRKVYEAARHYFRNEAESAGVRSNNLNLIRDAIENVKLIDGGHWEDVTTAPVIAPGEAVAWQCKYFDFEEQSWGEDEYGWFGITKDQAATFSTPLYANRIKVRQLYPSPPPSTGSDGRDANAMVVAVSALNAAAGFLTGYCPEQSKHLVARLDAAMAQLTARAGEG